MEKIINYDELNKYIIIIIDVKINMSGKKYEMDF